MISAYRHLFREVPINFSLYGVEAPRDAHTIQTTAGLEALSDYYVEMIEAIDPTPPLSLGGWCVGADLALLLQDKLNARSLTVDVVFGIDANLYFNSRNVFNTSIENQEDALWRLFADLMAGDENVSAILSSDEFKTGDTAVRVECVYKARDRNPRLSHIKRDLANPTWQFDFIQAIITQSTNYHFHGNCSSCHLMLFSGITDKNSVLREAMNMHARTIELAFYDSNHHDLLKNPHIQSIMTRVIAALQHSREGVLC